MGGGKLVLEPTAPKSAGLEVAPDAAIDHGNEQQQTAHLDVADELGLWLRPRAPAHDADEADDVGQLLGALAGAVPDLFHIRDFCLQNSPFVAVG